MKYRVNIVDILLFDFIGFSHNCIKYIHLCAYILRDNNYFELVYI